ncbi:MAG: type III pantothenate kinase [Candidatus Thiodiazotropha sp.]
MKLFVDLGNTAVKWATEDELDTHILHREQVDDLVDTLDRVWNKLAPPSEVAISSVRHQDLQDGMIQWIRKNWPSKVKIAKTRKSENGVTNGYAKTSQLGVDRWLAILGSWNLVHSSVLVVDCGTATTLDAIDARGVHLGGLILPGVRGFSRCLLSSTDLDTTPLQGEIDVFATDTATAIESGAILTHVCIIKDVLLKLQRVAQTQNEVQCLLTGGDAALLAPHLGIAYHLIPDLVLQGLALQSQNSD